MTRDALQRHAHDLARAMGYEGARLGLYVNEHGLNRAALWVQRGDADFAVIDVRASVLAAMNDAALKAAMQNAPMRQVRRG